jgi:hypothetical protein
MSQYDPDVPPDDDYERQDVDMPDMVEKPKKATIEIKTKDLEDFLSEVSRLAGILDTTTQKLNSIEKSTNVVHKLEQIADMDLKGFKNKFEDMVNNLDFNSHAREAIQSTLAPLTKEYQDSNVLLKNLIFELEKRYMPVAPKKSKWKIILIGLLAALVVGVGGYFIYTIKLQEPKFSFLLYAGAKIYKPDGAFLKISKNVPIKDAIKKGDKYQFEDNNGNQFQIDVSSVFIKRDKND